MESRETSGMVSRQFNLIKIQLECLQKTKNTSIYSPNWAKSSDRCVKLHQWSKLKRLKVNRYEYIAIVGSQMDALDLSSRRAL